MNRMHQIALAATIVVAGMTVASAATLDFSDNFTNHAFLAGAGKGVGTYNPNDATWGGQYTVQSGYCGWNNTQSNPNGYIRLGYQNTTNGVGPGTNYLTGASFMSMSMQNLLTRNTARGEGNYEIDSQHYRDTMVLAYQDNSNFLAFIGGSRTTSVTGVAGGNGGYTYTNATTANPYTSILYAFQNNVAYPILGINVGYTPLAADDVQLKVDFEPSKNIISVYEKVTVDGTSTSYSATGSVSTANIANLPQAFKDGGLFGVTNANTSSYGSNITTMSFAEVVPEPGAAMLLAGTCGLGLLTRQRRK